MSSATVTVSPLAYPSWIRERLTPQYEVAEVREPGPVSLWPHTWPPGLRRVEQDWWYNHGPEILATLKDRDLLARSLSYGHLLWLKRNSTQNPLNSPDYLGEWVCGWASVGCNDNGHLYVPMLEGGTGELRWNRVNAIGFAADYAGLKALPGSTALLEVPNNPKGSGVQALLARTIGLPN